MHVIKSYYNIIIVAYYCFFSVTIVTEVLPLSSRGRAIVILEVK